MSVIDPLSYRADIGSTHEDLQNKINVLSETYTNLTHEAAEGRYADVAWHEDEMRYALRALIGGLERFSVALVGNEPEDLMDTVHQLAIRMASGPMPQGFEKQDLIFLDIDEALEEDWDGDNVQAFLNECFEAREGIICVLSGVRRLRSWRYERIINNLSACVRGGLQVLCTVDGSKDAKLELPRVTDLQHISVHDAREQRLLYHLHSTYDKSSEAAGVTIQEAAFEAAADIALTEQDQSRGDVEAAKQRACELIDLAIGELRLRQAESEEEGPMAVDAELVRAVAE